jgi:plastocyanin
MRRILLGLCAVVASRPRDAADGDRTAARPRALRRPRAASSSGGGVAIKMQNIAFDPKAVTVKVGQKVTWTNDDSTDHNVTADSGADFKSDNFGNGGTFEFTRPRRAPSLRMHHPPGDDGDHHVQ